MIEVFDDLLSEEDFLALSEQVASEEFAWYYLPGTIETMHMKGDTPQFATMFDNENSRKIAKQALLRSTRRSIEIDDFLRIKANLLLPMPNRPAFHPPHVDMTEEGYLSVVYYLHDSDGDTFFFGDDNRTVTPKANRGVLFDSNIRHASSNPIATQRRMIINSVFRPK